ncbi:class I SAM-dependent methyltransferase [Salidesulfovibrio onnuriiensis]|uniref:class I SAM-dependent methyltransferase n=1 Tax=Salidesulfovibrio onnuriiensis TaxID=2583823 RepID=UPI0011C7D9E5|nr:class I SAM-dependent methyltransferase [Salidesulfovibrio onnuriiensis]
MQESTNDMPLEERFAFGQNWSKFIANLSPEQIGDARSSILARFPDGLEGKTFLDIGCGSGLFSLAARDLGARVVSFDFDPNSVECARYLKERFHPGDDSWEIFQGSVLNDAAMADLGRFDIVYSWGVLHHTGEMWHAMENAVSRVAPGGSLFIAIYNDQGGYSELWRAIKKLYVKSPEWARTLLCLMTFFFYEGRSLLIQIARLRNPFKYLMNRRQQRGMSIWTDVRDWVGGYPFEVAKPEAIFEYCRNRGFELDWLKTNGGGIACNEYVFKKKTV